MKLQMSLRASIPVQGLVIVLTCLAFAFMPVRACTIFVLTDTNHALFCNNEDWSNPRTRIWFLPASDGYYGAVYVGFNDGHAQGGLNTEGLAFDWVAGFKEKWAPDPKLPTARGDPNQRMLETCATVKDAITFYRNHSEPSFSYAKILVADRTGTSVIIGATNGQLRVEQDNQCRGFGFGRRTLDAALAEHPQPTVANGFKILRDCRQTGRYATKYSNIYDLKSGDIFLYPFPEHDDEVKLNLAVELKKVGHFYDMPQIKEQLTEAPLPLPPILQRYPLDEFKPIPDKEPEVTARLRTMIRDAAIGAWRADEYTAEAWTAISSKLNRIQDNLNKLGDFVSMTLVDRSEEPGQRSYRYRLEFANATVLQRFVLDDQGKLAALDAEAMEWKPGANVPEIPGTRIVGIGLALGVSGQNIVVGAILPGSPAAAQKDIRVGDRIIAVAQETGPAVPVQSATLTQAVGLIRGTTGTTVRLTIVSPGEDDSRARIVSFVRAELRTPYR